jgi:hypothetical protein
LLNITIPAFTPNNSLIIIILASSQFNPQYLARNNYLDWKALMSGILEDIEIVKGE